MGPKHHIHSLNVNSIWTLMHNSHSYGILWTSELPTDNIYWVPCEFVNPYMMHQCILGDDNKIPFLCAATFFTYSSAYTKLDLSPCLVPLINDLFHRLSPSWSEHVWGSSWSAFPQQQDEHVAPNKTDMAEASCPSITWQKAHTAMGYVCQFICIIPISDHRKLHTHSNDTQFLAATSLEGLKNTLFSLFIHLFLHHRHTFSDLYSSLSIPFLLITLEFWKLSRSIKLDYA